MLGENQVQVSDLFKELQAQFCQNTESGSFEITVDQAGTWAGEDVSLDLMVDYEVDDERAAVALGAYNNYILTISGEVCSESQLELLEMTGGVRIFGDRNDSYTIEQFLTGIEVMLNTRFKGLALRSNLGM